MKEPVRVAFLVEDNRTFLLPAVERTIELLGKGGYRTTHVGVVPPKLGKYTGASLPLWYLRVFGFLETGLVALLGILESLRRLRAHWSPEKRSSSWSAIGKKFGLECRSLTDPNSAESLEFLRASRCDILFILVPYVMGPEVLAIPSAGTINKHAAILPGCRGLFPYIWGTIHRLPLGVTFHKVTGRIDAGPILIQRRFGTGLSPRSMMEFYGHVFRMFPELSVAAVKVMLEKPAGEPQAPDVPNPYFGLPTRTHMKSFRAAGGRVIRVADLLWNHHPR